MRYSTVIGAILLASATFSAALAAEMPPYNHAIPVQQGPFLDPRTGSYFELRLNKVTHPYWQLARDQAASLTYQGRRGRLAVVKDVETLNFIREHFRFNEEAWIGMQFYCKYRKLLWVTGEVQPLNSPGMWAPRWYRNQNLRCSTQNISYMTVYLTEGRRPSDVSWQAAGPSKVFKSYLVEYPAPPAEAKKPADTDEKPAE